MKLHNLAFLNILFMGFVVTWGDSEEIFWGYRFQRLLIIRQE